MAERMVPEYQRVEEMAEAEIPNDLTPKSRAAFVKARMAAQSQRDDWKPWLFPEDDDG